ncbi:MAG: DUF3014 domain-containing protein [Georgfuchsia sp.]
MKKIIGWIVVFATIGAFAYYFWNHAQKPPPDPAVAKDIGVASVTPAPTPAKNKPVETLPVRPASSLPKLDESDTNVAKELSHLFGKENLLAYLETDKMIRRFVATIDNLPRQKAPERMMPMKPVPGSFMVSEAEHVLAINQANAKRYSGYVDLVRAVSVPALVDLYVKFYPLCQQAYRELGFPAGQFNDRLIEALDDLIAAPDVPPPVGLVQPKVLFQYADPEIEARSAGQKIMIRMGGDNEARVKAVLRSIRKEILLRTNTVFRN